MAQDNNRRGHGNRRRPQRNNNNQGQHNRSHGQHGHNSNPNSGNPAKMNAEELHVRYERLMEAHIDARKRYYEFFYRADDRERMRLEDNFYRTLNDWRRFEDNLPEEQKILLDKKVDSLDLDLAYSDSHQLNPEAEEVSVEGKFDDPHHMESQRNHEYKKDSEESHGTIEDYMRYKGKS